MARQSERNITWNRLAPSLQAMFSSGNYNNIITTLIADGDHGQLLKSNGENGIYVDDNMYIIRVAKNMQETSNLKAIGVISLKDVFNKWARVSSYGIGKANQNSGVGDQVAGRASYSYNDSNKCIYANMNHNCTAAFISDQLYSKFWIKIRMYGLDNDDDANIFVLAYMVDKDGVFHDVSVVRTGNRENQWEHSFMIAYDFVAVGGWLNSLLNGKPTLYKTLAYCDPPKRSWGGNFIQFYAEKNPGKVIAKTSDVNSTETDPLYDLSYELPDTKPDDWSDDDWANLRYMMLQATPLGFGTQSQPSRFMIMDQKEVFEEDNIYSMEDGVIYAYIDGKWTETDLISDILPHRVWLYNSVLNTLYWYQEPGVYVEIVSSLTPSLENAKEGQLIKVSKTGSFVPHDNFYNKAAVDNDADFEHQKILSTNDIYRLDTDEVYRYNGSKKAWVKLKKVSDELENSVFVYNNILYRLFFYYNAERYDRIVLS